MSKFGFYKHPIAINTDVHRNLKLIHDETDFSFAREVYTIYLTMTEFSDAAREYPIVFILDEDNKMRPVVILGVRVDENLFVDDQGKWDAQYIPAFIRRYPFVMAESGQVGQKVLCMDECCSAINMDHGELLINAEGKLEPRMNERLQFLINLQQEFTRTELVIKQLYDLKLFIKQNARFDTNIGKVFHLNDFYKIDEVKFRQIADDKLPELLRSGALDLVALHLASMGNMRELLKRLSNNLTTQKLETQTEQVQ